MSLESQIFDCLKNLVGGRVYPDTFPQKDGESNPWPAIRYTFISVVPDVTVCGSGSDDESDILVQLDGVAATGVARDDLRAAIQSAMRDFPIPTTCDSWSKEYDADTKARRVILEYTLHPSS